jgi:uncharacterized protein YgbK (DUF1537 family)
MIVIIADDFSGAAELAGIAAARGFTTEVQTQFDPSSTAEVIAVDTDTRSKSEAEAAWAVNAVTRQVISTAPAWIFKKTDSVLRGHVRAEIEAMLDATGQVDCLLIPANPSKQRTISGGRYYISGVPLDQTVFATDPDFPRRSASIATLLGPTSRICIPDVRGPADLPSPPDRSTLAAGGADFFAQILGYKAPQPLPPSLKQAHQVLLMSGSLAAWESGRAADMTARGFKVHLASEDPPSSIWQRNDRVMIAIGNQTSEMPHNLTSKLIGVAVSLIENQAGLTIALEGGATALAFIRQMGWTRFEVLPAGHTGVGCLRPPGGPLLFVKPGSYPWPHSLL